MQGVTRGDLDASVDAQLSDTIVRHRLLHRALEIMRVPSDMFRRVQAFFDERGIDCGTAQLSHEDTESRVRAIILSAAHAHAHRMAQRYASAPALLVGLYHTLDDGDALLFRSIASTGGTAAYELTDGALTFHQVEMVMTARGMQGVQNVYCMLLVRAVAAECCDTYSTLPSDDQVQRIIGMLIARFRLEHGLGTIQRPSAYID